MTSQTNEYPQEGCYNDEIIKKLKLGGNEASLSLLLSEYVTTMLKHEKRCNPDILATFLDKGVDLEASINDPKERQKTLLVSLKTDLSQQPRDRRNELISQAVKLGYFSSHDLTGLLELTKTNEQTDPVLEVTNSAVKQGEADKDSWLARIKDGKLRSSRFMAGISSELLKELIQEHTEDFLRFIQTVQSSHQFIERCAKISGAKERFLKVIQECQNKCHKIGLIVEAQQKGTNLYTFFAVQRGLCKPSPKSGSFKKLENMTPKA